MEQTCIPSAFTIFHLPCLQMEYCDSASRAWWKFTVKPSEIGLFRKMHKKTCIQNKRNYPRLLMSFGKLLDNPSAPKTGISGRAPSTGGA